MSYLYEKVSYLKGLADGMEIGSDSKEGKLLVKMIEVLEEITYSIEDIEQDIEEIDEVVAILSE